jgi:hypothetical protein
MFRLIFYCKSLYHGTIDLLLILLYRLASRRKEVEIQYHVAQEWRATQMMTSRYCQAVGCYDAIETHKRYSSTDNIGLK